MNTEGDDEDLLRAIEEDIYNRAGGADNFRRQFPALLRKAIDEVIDTARSARFTLAETDKVEKTYLGLKIEIVLRHYLDAPRGSKLDLLLAGVAVDVKHTIYRNWTIPSEAIGHPCVLIREDERLAICSFGLLVVREQVLNPGRNRDGKRTLTRAGMAQVKWLLHDAPYPKNFWLTLKPEIQTRIVEHRGGTGRMAALFREVQQTCIPRSVLEALGQQKDPMKRIRKNGGARDILAREGIAILWGRTESEVIAELGLPPCGADEFISVRAVNRGQRRLLGLPDID